MEFREKGNLPEDNFTGQNMGDSVKENSPVEVLTAKTITGDSVVNEKGETLGTIEDIMLNIRTGKIEYVVMSFGGFLGFGEKFFAIPFNALRLDTKNEKFVLNYSKDVFEKAPGFDKDHWPKTNSRHYEEVTTYWGNFMGPNTGAVPY